MRPPPFGSDHHPHHHVPTSSSLDVPFVKPVTSSPASLGFGFVPKHASPSPILLAAGPSRRGPPSMTFGGPVAAGLRVAPAAGRKRRSPSPIEVEMGSGTDPAHRRAIKKIRGGAGETAAAKPEVDVGKSLAHLSKHELLSVLQSLLSSNPALSTQIEPLLPAPSLSSFTSHLSTLESAVLASLPLSSTQVRPEYVWSRCRPQVEEYVSEARYWLSAFCPPSSSSPDAEPRHPSTVFSFLEALTLSVLRLEEVLPPAPTPFFPPSSSSSGVQTAPTTTMMGGTVLNPLDPLASSLIPNLFNRWHHLVTRVSTECNSQGKVYGHETVRHWIRALDAMSAGQRFGGGGRAGLAKAAIDGVRGRIVAEVGWVAGVKPPAVALVGPEGMEI